MTSPVVGTVSVEVVASARELARSLKREVESAFKDLDLRSAVRSAVGNTKVKLPVEPELDTSGITAKVRGARVPKVPVELDPVLQAFQQEVRRQTAALARQLNVNVPVGADTAGLRQQLGAELQEIKQRSRMEVPTEPGGKAAYEARLKAQLAEVAARVKQTVKVDVDTRGGNALASLGALIKGFGRGLPNLGGLASGISSIGGALQQAAGSSAQLGGSLTGAFTSAAGPIGLVIGLLTTAAAAMAAIGTAAVLVVPAVAAVAGAAAAIPAALAGAGAAFGALGLGFKGISDAFSPKKAGGGGGGGGAGSDPAAQARRIAAAERGVESARRGIASATRGLQSAERGYRDAVAAVADAQKRAQAAQAAVNRARREAVEDLDDLNRSLRGAQLSEEDATLSVEEALRALNEAQLTGDIPSIKRADLAYREALQTLDEAKDTTDDLSQATDEANSKGVEGSDKVQSALADQADALKGVKQAQEGVLDAQNAVLSAQDGLKSANDAYLSSLDSLAEAQKKVAAGGGGGGGLGQQLVKLAPAAQAFVNAVKALKPAFEDLRLDVQQRLFAGLDKTVTRIGETWIPALKVTLGRYADTFNGFFRSLGASITTPKFIADIQAGAEGARQGMEAIGSAVTSKLVPAFGALARAAGPFLTALGQEIADIVTDFSNWVLQGEKTGGLKDFFTKAAEGMHDIFTTGRLVVGIVGNIIAAIIGPGQDTKKSAVDSLNDGLAKLNGWLSKPETQQGIHDVIVAAGNAVVDIARFVSGLVEFAGEVDRVATKIGNVLGGFTPDGTRPLGVAMWDGIKQGFSEAFHASVDFLAGLLWSGPDSLVGRIKSALGIKSPSTVMAAVGVDVVAGLVVGIQSWFGRLAQTVAGLRATVINTLRDAGSWLVNFGRNAVAGFINGAISLFVTAVSRVQQLRSLTINALRDAGSWLYNAGRNVVIGIANGISSLGPWLWNKVVNFATSIKNAAKSALGIASPSKVMAELGKEIPAGMAVGISANAATVADAMSDLTGMVAGSQMPGLGLDADVALTRSLQAASTQRLEASWAPGSTGDPVLDAFRRLIELRFRGDVQLALGSN